MKPIRVMIVDDHAIVRMGLAALIDSCERLRLVAEASSADEALAKAASTRPDVVIMDLMMPDKDGIEATRSIKANNPAIRVLVLTTSTVPDELDHAIRAGASGALTKSTSNETLIETIQRVAAGETCISPEIRDLLKSSPPIPTLTPKQLLVAEYIVRGLSNSEIAKLLGISKDRVKQHVSAIFGKLGAANRAEAIATILRRNLLHL